MNVCLYVWMYACMDSIMQTRVFMYLCKKSFASHIYISIQYVLLEFYDCFMTSKRIYELHSNSELLLLLSAAVFSIVISHRNSLCLLELSLHFYTLYSSPQCSLLDSGSPQQASALHLLRPSGWWLSSGALATRHSYWVVSCGTYAHHISLLKIHVEDGTDSQLTW